MAIQENQRCDTCKFWGDRLDGSLHEWAHCSLLSESGSLEPEPGVWDTDVRARAHGRDEGEGYLSTRENFGCVEWRGE